MGSPTTNRPLESSNTQKACQKGVRLGHVLAPPNMFLRPTNPWEKIKLNSQENKVKRSFDRGPPSETGRTLSETNSELTRGTSRPLNGQVCTAVNHGNTHGQQ
eukprot:TRINITY_DN8734_c0_g2_i10.p4 TRINITY_DN8734_c0_g2~~TRINITY_DN8734_c0_g2_i10.p4  ORF type:complete len:103 (+),score=7.81 TRINITY_DN8734_c0_g2_i10:1920-2228(+)